jgi:hypothetical protein
MVNANANDCQLAITPTEPNPRFDSNACDCLHVAVRVN